MEISSWFILGITSGLTHALMSTVSKRALKEVNPYLVAFSWAFFSLPILFLSLFWLDLAPTNITFWYATLACAAMSVIAMVFYMKALSIGELSLTVPFLSFTPLFLIFTSKLILGEFPSFIGIGGILFIVAGAYTLQLKEERGILGPFKALVKNRGAQLMLLVAFIFSIMVNFSKIAILNSNPVTYIVFVQIISVPVFLFLVFLKSDQKIGEMKSKLRYLFPIGALVAITLLCQMTALNLALVSYVISLKRTTALFSVILGFIAFKERNIRPRLAGACLMVLGVFLISIS